MNADKKKVVSVLEAAEILGIGKNLCYELARLGRIPALRLGRRLVISRAALDKMLAEAGQKTPASGQERGA